MEIPVSFFNISFNKAMAFGYRTEDVDDFVTKAVRYIKDLQEENDILREKLGILAQNLEKYREEEDSLRSALVGAQKLGDSILKESRSKAEALLRDATARADKVVMDAALEQERAEHELNRLQNETADFKDNLFALYRVHLDMLRQIPEDRTPVQHRTPPPAAQVAPQPEEAEDPQDPAISPETDNGGQQYFPQDAYAPEDDSSYEEPVEDIQLAAPSIRYQEIDPREDFLEDEDEAEEPTDAVPVMAVGEDAAAMGDDTTFYQPRSARNSPSARHGLGGKRPIPQPAPEDIFAPAPMVQMEFYDSNDDGEDDEFSSDTKNLRSVELGRIPYFDDEDEDEGELASSSPSKRPIISQKFGELQFGSTFNVNGD